MAARYFIAGGVDNNWDTSGNWSATDGGAASGVKPTASDDVFFTSNSPNCTVNTAGVGKTLDFTTYANTITMTAGLTISGSVTLVSAMTIAGASGLTVNAAGTLKSSTKVWPNNLSITGTATYTLADTWNVDGTLSIGLAGANIVINDFQINASGSLTHNSTTGITSGTTLINLDGTGNWTGSSSTGPFRLSVTIDTAGTITIVNGSGGSFIYNTGTLTHIAGTVITTGTTLVSTVATTFACAGINWNNFSISLTSVTHTFNEDFNVDGLFTAGATTNTTTLNGSTMYLSGGFTFTSTTGHMLGTTNLVFDGTGTITGSNNTGSVRNNLTINTAGTITFATGIFSYNTGTLTYTAGTVVVTAGSVLHNQAVAVTLATNGITWKDVTLTGSVTVTLSNALALSGLLSLAVTSNALVLTGSTISVGGGIRFGYTTGNVSGTTVLILTGTGTVDAPSVTTGSFTNPVDINASGGTITITNSIKGLLNQLQYLAGTVITDNGTWASGGGGGSFTFS